MPAPPRARACLSPATTPPLIPPTAARPWPSPRCSAPAPCPCPSACRAPRRPRAQAAPRAGSSPRPLWVPTRRRGPTSRAPQRRLTSPARPRRGSRPLLHAKPPMPRRSRLLLARWQSSASARLRPRVPSSRRRRRPRRSAARQRRRSARSRKNSTPCALQPALSERSTPRKRRRQGPWAGVAMTLTSTSSTKLKPPSQLAAADPACSIQAPTPPPPRLHGLFSLLSLTPFIHPYAPKAHRHLLSVVLPPLPASSGAAADSQHRAGNLSLIPQRPFFIIHALHASCL
mmetsp:Transcript_2595/g.7415  ORF Transcript_2595/g.7415 Transcript_2595/m.7415 type:complete len:287 (-) Transcript_2595:464-1324(-)